eukprot:RCo003962
MDQCSHTSAELITMLQRQLASEVAESERQKDHNRRQLAEERAQLEESRQKLQDEVFQERAQLARHRQRLEEGVEKELTELRHRLREELADERALLSSQRAQLVEIRQKLQEDVLQERAQLARHRQVLQEDAEKELAEMRQNLQDQFSVERAQLSIQRQKLEETAAEKNAELLRDRLQLEENRKAFSDECARMQALTHPGDIVEINAGGKVFTTERNTLTRYPESLLGILFNGRWESSVAKDKEGRVFLDVNPTLFENAFEMLRKKAIGRREIPCSVPTMTPEDKADFEDLAMYLGVADVLLMEPLASFEFNFLRGVVATRQGKGVKSTATHSNFDSCAVGATVLPAVCQWNVKIHALRNNFWVHLGVIHNRSPGRACNNDPTCYGFACLDQTYQAGVITPKPGWSGFCAGDEVSFELNSIAGTLTMTHWGTNFRLTGMPTSASWRVYASLYGEGDEIEVIPLRTSEEL